jgi:hypothetical protein
MSADHTNEGETLALGALGWVLAEEVRAARLLALTGLTPDLVRARVQDRDFLAAVAHRLGDIGVRAQQVAEQFQIELVVLDNQDFLSHRAFLGHG